MRDRLRALPLRVKALLWPQAPGLTLGDHGCIGTLSWVLLAIGDLAISGHNQSVMMFGWVLGVSIAVGVLYGFGAGLPLLLLAPTRWKVRTVAAAMTVAAVSAFLIHAFNAISALDGETRTLALVSMGVSVALGLYVAGVGLAMLPTGERPRGWVNGVRWRYRWMFIVPGLGAGAAAIWADRGLWHNTYPLVHAFLQWATWLTLYFVLVASWPYVKSRLWLTLSVSGLLLALGLVPLFTLTADKQDALYSISQHPFSARPLLELRLLTDLDGDGYSSLLGGTDCDPLDGNVSPGTQEIPANGIDDDCFNGDANYVASKSGDIPTPTDDSPVSVVLITVDTLRPDRMSLYGAKRDTTKRVDQWARSALVFDRAYAGGAWTSLSLTSLFRGVYPRRVNWTWVYETNKWRLVQAPLEANLRAGEEAKKAFAMPVHETRRPFPWFLKRRGMITAAVVDDGHSMFLEQSLKVAGDEFNSYFMADSLPRAQRTDKGVAKQAIRELRTLNKGGKPFFLWTHFFGPHSPSQRPKGLKPYGQKNIDSYDLEIAFWDQSVMPLLKEIDRVAKTKEVAVIITADHGERIWENFRGHGGDVTEQNVRVPLIVRGPGIKPGRSKQLVSLVDLFPTIMGWTRTPGPDDIDGMDLVELIRGGPKPRTLIAETWRFSRTHQRELDLVAAINDTHKLTWNLVSEARSLHRIGKHFAKKENLIEKEKQPDLDAAMNRYLERNRRVSISE